MDPVISKQIAGFAHPTETETMEEKPYTGVLTVAYADGRIETKVHHLTALNYQIAAFRLGELANREYEPPYGITSVILFAGRHRDLMPLPEDS